MQFDSNTTRAEVNNGNDKLLSLENLKEICGKSTPTIYRWIKAGTFPKPVMPGRWSHIQVQQHLSKLRGDGQ